MKSEKNIDKLFKHGLEDPVNQPQYQESDWDDFEQMLDAGNKRTGIIYWLPALCSAAAVLLFLGWWMFRVEDTTDPIKIQQPIARASKNAPHMQPATPGKADNTLQRAQVAANTNTDEKHQVKAERVASKQTEYLASSAGKFPVLVTSNTPVAGESGDNTLTGNGAKDLNTVAAVTDNLQTGVTTLMLNSPEADITTENIDMPAIAAVNIVPKMVNGAGVKTDKLAIKKSVSSFKPQYGLSVLASSEQNGVGSLRQTSSGINFGVLVSAGYKKLTVTTGASYSLKPYSLPFADYRTAYKFQNTPESVSADCRVLDIPVNLDYQVYNMHRNKLSIGTGLSSYIMLHESYTYDYGNANALYGPSYYAVKNRGSYLFSIMNLQMTYQRQVNANAWLTIQPYLKLPLSYIGYSQIKVETFGVAVGLNWNLNSLTKAK